MVLDFELKYHSVFRSLWGFVCFLFFFLFFLLCSMISWNAWMGKRNGVWWSPHGNVEVFRPSFRMRLCLFSTWMWVCGTWHFTMMARTKKWSLSVQLFWVGITTSWMFFLLLIPFRDWSQNTVFSIQSFCPYVVTQLFLNTTLKKSVKGVLILVSWFLF